MKKTELTINLQEADGNGKIKMNFILIKGNGILPDFFICDAPITQSTWNTLMEKKGEVENGCFGVGEDYPIYFVNVQDCKDFISELNDQFLRELKKASTPYTFDKFDLPTEAQWEYVANGGTVNSGYIYSGSDNIDEVSWYNKNSNGRVHEVKTKKPNALGIYDMSGNVMEWCRKEENSEIYVTRGGSWNDSEQNCRIKSRSTIFDSKTSASIIGLRIVLNLEE